MSPRNYAYLGLVFAAAGCHSGEQGKAASNAAEPVTPVAVMDSDAAKVVASCHEAFNARRWEAYQSCFTSETTDEDVDQGPARKGAEAIVADRQKAVAMYPDIQIQRQLTLVSGEHVVDLALITWTATERAAAHKKVGFLMARVSDVDAATKKIKGMWSFFDPATVMGQMGIASVPHRPPMHPWTHPGGVVVTSGSPDESAHLDAHHAALAAFNNHDATLLESDRAADVIWSDQSRPADVDGATMSAGVQRMWRGFSKLELSVGGEFAAGDFVVFYGQLTGTNDGDFNGTKSTGRSISVHTLQVQEFRKGKVVRAWAFENGFAIPEQLGLFSH